MKKLIKTRGVTMTEIKTEFDYWTASNIEKMEEYTTFMPQAWIENDNAWDCSNDDCWDWDCSNDDCWDCDCSTPPAPKTTPKKTTPKKPTPKKTTPKKTKKKSQSSTKKSA